MSIEERIVDNYEELTDSDLHILGYVLKNISNLSDVSITKLAEETHTSISTIHRLAIKLKFSGFSEFKYALRNNSDGEKTISSTTYREKILKQTEKVLSNIDENKVRSWCDNINHSDNLYIYGTGWKADLVAQKFVNDMMYYNKTGIHIKTASDLKKISKKMNNNDALFIISFTGNTDVLQEVLPFLRLKGIYISSITSKGVNILSKFSHDSFYHESCILSYKHDEIVHWSSVQMEILIDYLVIAYASN